MVAGCDRGLAKNAMDIGHFKASFICRDDPGLIFGQPSPEGHPHWDLAEAAASCRLVAVCQVHIIFDECTGDGRLMHIHDIG